MAAFMKWMWATWVIWIYSTCFSCPVVSICYLNESACSLKAKSKIQLCLKWSCSFTIVNEVWDRERDIVQEPNRCRFSLLQDNSIRLFPRLSVCTAEEIHHWWRLGAQKTRWEAKAFLIALSVMSEDWLGTFICSWKDHCRCLCPWKRPLQVFLFMERLLQVFLFMERPLQVFLFMKRP